MKRFLIVGALVFSTSSLHSQDQGTIRAFLKGSWLFHGCQAYVRAIDADKSGDAASMNSAMECLNYVQGFNEGVEMSSPPFCAPDATTTETMIRVYVNYIHENPKLLDEHRAQGLMQALKSNYPCPTK